MIYQKTLVSLVLVFIFTIFSFPTSYAEFYDVKSNDYSYISINFLTEENIINGYSDGSFKPDNFVNRAEFLVMVINAFNINLDVNAWVLFEDVDNNSWYGPTLRKAYKEAWVNGYNDGLFHPNKGINKAEALKIIGEIKEWNKDEEFWTSEFEQYSYTDINSSDWFSDYVQYAYSHNFLDEKGAFLNPNSAITRADLSEILYRILIQERGLQVVERVKDHDVLLNIPFTAQAPFGEWNDIRQSEGCEEASAFMAVKWARGESFSLEDAKSEILAISEFQTRNYGTAHDSSAKDTVDWIVHDYFGFYNVEIMENINTFDIKKELYNGNAVIITVNGKKLINPYFSGGGPLQHMLLIKGYDSVKNEFIANEPGTRFGDGFRYPANMIEDALYDYESGDKNYLPERVKRMIVVKPESRLAMD